MQLKIVAYMEDEMSRKEKLIERLKQKPKDFTFEEVIQLLGYFGYEIVAGGKTGGSRIAFSNSKKDYIRMHKPHPRSILKAYQVQNLIDDLKERDLI